MKRQVLFDEIVRPLWCFGMFVAVVVAMTMPGCGPAPQGGGVVEMPNVRPTEAHVHGAYVTGVSDDGEAWAINLDTGVATGGNFGTVRSWGVLSAGGTLEVNGTPQALDIETHHELVDGTWERCLLGEVVVMGWTARGRFPWSESCGASGVELVYNAFPSEPGGARAEQPSPTRADR
jgi:hypothetical protein